MFTVMGISRFVRRARWDDERARELEAHLAIAIDENVARGMSPDEARDQARRKLGNLTSIREDIYQMNSLPILETLRLDLRDAVRQLRRKPLVTALALLLLTIGIAASATGFSVAYGILVRPLPFPDANRIATLWATADGRRTQVSLPDLADIRASVPFADVAALAGGRVTLTGRAEADRVVLVNAQSGLWRMLGVRAVLGRLPVESDEGGSAAVISERLWRSAFHADPAVVGQQVGVNGSPYTVVGVVGRDLEFEMTVPGGAGSGFTLKDVDIWTPFNLVAGIPPSREVSSSQAVVRIKAGDSLEQAQAAIDVVAARLAREYPATNRDRRFLLMPFHRQAVESATPIVMLGLAGSLLLLVIACANVASLFLGDLPERRRDFALRSALGAGRVRLVRQLALEALLLAGAGSLAGLAIARPAVGWLKRAADLPRVDAIRFDLPVTAAIVAAALVAALAARLAPLVRLRESRDDLRASVSAYAASAPRLRGALVAGQMALAVLLSSTALLLGFSLRHLIDVDPGFAPAHTVAARVSAYAARHPDKLAVARFVNEIVHRLSLVPGVRSVGAGQSLPLTASAGGTSVAIEGRKLPMHERPVATWYTVTPGYFQTLGVPMLEGRDFTGADLGGPSHKTVINRVLARRLFGDERPIGRRVMFGPDGSDNDWHEVVGIVGDLHGAALSAAPGPAAYDLFGQHWGRSVFLVVRGDADPYALVPSIRATVRELDPEAPVFDVRSLDDIVSGAVAPRRLATAFAIGTAGISVLLAALGLYGLLASSVAARTREFGIRRALGSPSSALVQLVFTDAALLGAAGIAAGLACAYAVARMIQTQLFGVEATDPSVAAMVVAALIAVAAIATLVPARRASRVDPAVALRTE